MSSNLIGEKSKEEKDDRIPSIPEVKIIIAQKSKLSLDPRLEYPAMQDRRDTMSRPEQIEADKVDYQKLDTVRVVCRFRPSNRRELQEEKRQGLEQVDPIIEGTKLTVSRTVDKKKSRSEHSMNKTFYLDKTIDWEGSQSRCFRVIGFPMVESVLAGYNATIFAYGQTGSGKTYTMFGPEGGIQSPRHVGLIQRAVDMLFWSLRKRKDGKNDDESIESYKLEVQFVQIYKEKLVDLLNPIAGADLKIRWDKKAKAPYVENVTKVVAHNTKEVLKLMNVAISNRVTDKTSMNAVSSRSHLVMTIRIQFEKFDGSKISAKLNFGDLAGSESMGKTHIAVGSKQFQELRSINQSLTQLTTVINDIVKKRRPAYRNSKLTHILQDSFGGNTKTTIVVCASPHVYNRDETIRTMNFAMAAKTIKNKATVNKDYSPQQLKKRVKMLESENDILKTTIAKLEGLLKL